MSDAEASSWFGRRRYGVWAPLTPGEAARCVIAGTIEVRLGREGLGHTAKLEAWFSPQPPPAQRGPNGRRLCRWCHAEVPSGRRSWCGQACVDDYLAMKDWRHLAERVRRRDGGICQICGADVRLIERAARWANRWGEGWDPRINRATLPAALWRYRGAGMAWVTGEGFNRHQRLYQIDHIRPRIEGGSNRLENLRLVCVPCHKAETARLAGRRARPHTTGTRTDARTPAAHPAAHPRSRARARSER